MASSMNNRVIMLHLPTTKCDWFVNAEGFAVMDAWIGETVGFSWDSNHNVYIHPSDTCDTEGAIFVGDESGATTYT
eukprot:55959_4